MTRRKIKETFVTMMPDGTTEAGKAITRELTGNVRHGRVEAMPVTGTVTRFNTRHAQTHRLFVLNASNMSHKRRAPVDGSSEIGSVDNSASEEEPEFHVGKHHKSSILHFTYWPMNLDRGDNKSQGGR